MAEYTGPSLSIYAVSIIHNATSMYILGIVITLLVGFVIGMLVMMHILDKEAE